MWIDFEWSPVGEAAASLIFPDSAEPIGEANRTVNAAKACHLVIFPPMFNDLRLIRVGTMAIHMILLWTQLFTNIKCLHRTRMNPRLIAEIPPFAFAHTSGP